MRMIIIAAIAVLVLGGGAAGAFFYLSGSEAQAASGEEVHDKKEAKNKDKDKGVEKAVEFVNLAPLMLPIVTEDGVSQTVSVVVALEVHDPKDAAMVSSMSPKLTDAFIQDLYGGLNEHAALKGGIIQVGAIKKRLSKISDQVMGDNVIHDVLLQVVQQRPI